LATLTTSVACVELSRS